MEVIFCSNILQYYSTFFFTERFERVPKKWEGKYELFSIKSCTYPQLFLAVDTKSPNSAVRGMASHSILCFLAELLLFQSFQTKEDMGDCVWKIVHIKPESTYFALQYCGTYYGYDTAYYFFIENIENEITFRIAQNRYGHLGFIPAAKSCH